MAQGGLLHERQNQGDTRAVSRIDTELTVACVCTGGIYNNNHVQRLRWQIKEYLTIPYRFHCITESPWPDWWGKINLFQPGRFAGRVLYLDLDVTVIGSLDDLVNIDSPFTAIKDYQYPLTINSSVMVWDAGIADHVYNDFTPDVMERFRGDQNWIYHKMPYTRRFPREWCVSFKAGKVTKDTRVVVYHGFPKPWDIH